MTIVVFYESGFRTSKRHAIWGTFVTQIQSRFGIFYALFASFDGLDVFVFVRYACVFSCANDYADLNGEFRVSLIST
jgi:hypothetical protein